MAVGVGAGGSSRMRGLGGQWSGTAGGKGTVEGLGTAGLAVTAAASTTAEAAAAAGTTAAAGGLGERSANIFDSIALAPPPDSSPSAVEDEAAAVGVLIFASRLARSGLACSFLLLLVLLAGLACESCDDTLSIFSGNAATVFGSLVAKTAEGSSLLLALLPSSVPLLLTATGAANSLESLAGSGTAEVVAAAAGGSSSSSSSSSTISPRRFANLYFISSITSLKIGLLFDLPFFFFCGTGAALTSGFFS
mmetsp:Transcript_25202/g.34660  ORF Transcript_25202/g.34660 Transcript_25202/m.34660 type:complete len:250 (+) Transcript_25202:1778-2527(+)